MLVLFETAQGFAFFKVSTKGITKLSVYKPYAPD